MERIKATEKLEGTPICSIAESPKRNKRFRITLKDGRHFDIGLLNPVIGTYIDHGDKELRRRYWARHYGNARERELIDNMIPSASLYSAYILWGASKSIQKNIRALNKFIISHSETIGQGPQGLDGGGGAGLLGAGMRVR